MALILVIDDDQHMRRACSRVLEMAGWDVVCAETGDEGLAAVRNATEPIDAMLVDRLMPGMSGVDVLAEIRAINPNLPVIIMTGSATEDSVIELKQMGAFDCLAKPFTPEQLRSILALAVKYSGD